MLDRERRGWIIVGAIFVTMFFIWGGINCGAVFFVPVLKTFGWTRAKLSVAVSIGWITGGAAGPLIGLVADRVNPKKMMIVGATVTGLAWLALSRATGFGQFLAINGLFGISVGATTTIPTSLIIAGWFEQRRGLAMGIAFAGATLGGAAMTIIATYAIASGGWRFGYLILALPILFVVVPMIVIFVQTSKASDAREAARPGGGAEARARAAAPSVVLPGLELAQARRTRSFWLLCLIQMLAGLSSGMGAHFIAYLTGIGYTAAFAATVVSLYLIGTTAGTLLGGPLADRAGARMAMVVTFTCASIGMVGLMGAVHGLGLVVNVVAGGFAAGALAVQMPLVMIESLGVRRLGSVMGITSVFFTFGAFASPIATGRIFDVTGSYAPAIAAFIVMLAMCAAAMLGMRPLEREQEQFALPAQSSAAM
ncbi:MAG TPA: MFS transporter [Candidatus Binataceae bacterium]|nr:MFS transporter [Candidatus Binataceae bacterium]